MGKFIYENNISKIDFHRGHWRGNSSNPGGDNMIKVIIMEKK